MSHLSMFPVYTIYTLKISHIDCMKNKLIFFVDDDKMMLNLMEYTFKCRDGFDVQSFFSGESCLEHLGEKPSLIVLDYYLGEGESTAMSGLDTLKKINESDTQYSCSDPQQGKGQGADPGVSSLRSYPVCDQG